MNHDTHENQATCLLFKMLQNQKLMRVTLLIIDSSDHFFLEVPIAKGQQPLVIPDHYLMPLINHFKFLFPSDDTALENIMNSLN